MKNRNSTKYFIATIALGAILLGIAWLSFSHHAKQKLNLAAKPNMGIAYTGLTASSSAEIQHKLNAALKNFKLPCNDNGP